MAVAAAARLAVSRPLWLDEAATAEATGGSLREALAATRTADAHPPLIDGLVWLARQGLGAGDLVLRTPSLLAGLALVPVVYVTATRLYDRRTGLVAAVVAALGPGLLWLSGGAGLGWSPPYWRRLRCSRCCGRSSGAGRSTGCCSVSSALCWCGRTSWRSSTPLCCWAQGVVVVERWRSRTAGAGRALAGWAGAALLTGAAGAARLPGRLGAADGAAASGVRHLRCPRRRPLGARSRRHGRQWRAGLHPRDVTSRLLALWPLAILATFALTVRAWSRRGLLLVVLAVTPFAALLVAQVAGAPRNPLVRPGVDRHRPPHDRHRPRSSRHGRRRPAAARVFAAVGAAVLVLAAADQATRWSPSSGWT